MVITKIDLAVVLVLFAISLASYPSNMKRLNPALYRGTLGQEINQPDNWLFDADSATVTENMYDRYSDQTLNRRHPLFSVVMIPLTFATAFFSRLPRIDAAILVFSFVGCLWGSIYYLALKALLEDRIAAVLCAAGNVQRIDGVLAEHPRSAVAGGPQRCRRPAPPGLHRTDKALYVCPAWRVLLCDAGLHRD